MAADPRTVALRRHLRVVAFIGVLVMAPLVFFFTTEGTWNLAKHRTDGGWSAGFYMAQLESMMHGRLDVARTDIISECWDRDGRCYGYFGITPSLVRLPALGILRWLGSSLTPLFVGIAVLLAYWAALGLVRRALLEFTEPDDARPVVLGYAVISALALGPGGTLVFLTRPGVYEEAVAWALAFFLLAVDRVWAWWRTGRRRPLVVAILLAIASANARPTAVTACGVLGLTMLALWRLRRAQFAAGITQRPAVVAALCLMLLPFLTAGGVFWLKFRAMTPDLTLNEQVPEAGHWRDVLERNGHKTKGLAFLPTEIVAYLRPDALRRRRMWPPFDFPYPRNPVLWLPPLPEGGAYVEKHTTLTATMPMSWLLNGVVAVWLVFAGWRTRSALTREQWVLAAGTFASAVAMTALTLTTVGITNRYLSDFFAVSVVGLAVGTVVVLPTLRRRPIVAALAGLVALIALAWSVLVTVSLNIRLVFP